MFVFAVEIYCCRHVHHTTGITNLCFISFRVNTLKNSFHALDLVGYLAPQFMVPEILKLYIPCICSNARNTTKCIYTIKIQYCHFFVYMFRRILRHLQGEFLNAQNHYIL